MNWFVSLAQLEHHVNMPMNDSNINLSNSKGHQNYASQLLSEPQIATHLD